LYVRRIGPGFTLGQRECTELLARYQFRKPFLLLLVCPKKQQRPDPDRVVRVYENRCRCATAADFLQEFAIGHLRKTPSAVFHWRSRTEHTDAPEPVDDLTRNIRLSIYLHRIEMLVEELRRVKSAAEQRCIQAASDWAVRGHRRMRAGIRPGRCTGDRGRPGTA